MQSAFVLGLKRFCYTRYTVNVFGDVCRTMFGRWNAFAACSSGNPVKQTRCTIAECWEVDIYNIVGSYEMLCSDVYYIRKFDMDFLGV